MDHLGVRDVLMLTLIFLVLQFLQPRIRSLVSQCLPGHRMTKGRGGDKQIDREALLVGPIGRAGR
jgi:hypothetical protein